MYVDPQIIYIKGKSWECIYTPKDANEDGQKAPNRIVGVSRIREREARSLIEQVLITYHLKVF
jgi:hypothetical protein